MLRFRINHEVALFLAPLALYCAAIPIAALVNRPSADMPWGQGVYVALTSALLIGFPTRSVLRRMRLVSLRAYILGGAISSFIPATAGASFRSFPSNQGTLHAVSWFHEQPAVTAFMIAVYTASGCLVAATYWGLARPDVR